MKILLGLVLTIIHVQGVSKASIDSMPASVARAQKYFQQVGVRLRIQHLQIDDDSCKNTDISYRNVEVHCYHKMRQKLALKKNSLAYFLVGGWTYGENGYYFGGEALAICSTTAIGTAHDRDITYMPKEYLNGDLIAHEMFHAMCATHTEPETVPSIMSRWFYGHWKVGQTVPILDVTKRQINRWKSKVRTRL